MEKITASDVLNCDTSEAEVFLDLWEKMAKAYFFVPPTTSGSRRAYEIRHSMSFKCSAKNIYCGRTIKENGEIKRINNLKKTIKNIKEYASKCPIDELPLFINSKYKDEAAKRLAGT